MGVERLQTKIILFPGTWPFPQMPLSDTCSNRQRHHKQMILWTHSNRLNDTRHQPGAAEKMNKEKVFPPRGWGSSSIIVFREHKRGWKKEVRVKHQIWEEAMRVSPSAVTWLLFFNCDETVFLGEHSQVPFVWRLEDCWDAYSDRLIERQTNRFFVKERASDCFKGSAQPLKNW